MINKNILKLLGHHKIKIVYITLLKIVSLLCYIACLGFLCLTIAKIIKTSDILYLWYLCAIPLFIAIKVVVDKINVLTQSKLANLVEVSLRKQLFNKIVSNPCENPKYDSQALSQLSIEGIEQLNLYYTSYFPQFFYAMLSPLILFIIISFLSIPTSIFFFMCVPLIPISIIFVSKFAKKIFANYWDKYMSMGGAFLDNIKGMKELKIFLYDSIRQKQMDNNAEEFRDITMKVLVMQLWSTSIMDLVTYGGSAIGSVIALSQLINGNVTSPFYVLFIILIGVEFFMPMRVLGSLFHISMNGVTAGEKILDILETKNALNGREACDVISSIEFENATLAYTDQIVLDNLSFNFHKAGIYAIVGNSGSGKSTLIKALNRSLDLASGKLLINNVDIKSIRYSSLMQRIVFISYDSHIFKGTVRENFLFINPSVNESTMKDSLNKVLLNEFDLDFYFEEDASNVSGGQKQRFILAFYLTLNKDVFVFDETTSNIDKESEDIIIDLIKKMRKDRIVLLISHRLANVIDSDEILFIHNQILFAHGQHKELLKNQEYRKLYNQQILLEGGK